MRYLTQTGIYLCVPGVEGLPTSAWFYLLLFDTHADTGKIGILVDDGVTYCYIGKINPVAHTSQWKSLG